MQDQNIQKTKLVDHLKQRKVQDFSYAILFLLISSFFAYFVIRPVLSIAVALRREGQDLERINKVYEENIAKVLQLQADLESVRPKVHLLQEALPESPKVDALITDIRKVAAEERIQLDNVSIEGMQIKADKKDVKVSPGQLGNVKITMSITGSYEDGIRFVRALALQRRIKTIHSVDLSSERDPKASSSAMPSFIRLRLNVQAYYL